MANENPDEELLVNEDKIKDQFGDDPANTVVLLANNVEKLRIQVRQLSSTVNDFYNILREVAPDRLSRYELKSEVRRLLAERKEEEQGK